jgi:predicted Zn-dependent protease
MNFYFRINKLKKLPLLLLSIVASATLPSCATSPEGRTQLTLISDSEMDTMGVQSFTQIKQQTAITKNKNIQQYVSCIANKIIPYVKQNPNPYQWEVVVFESEQANAFALPGYKIGVYTGLLKYAKNQDQLAAVMGHEVAHVIAKHSNERVSHQMATKAGLDIAAVFLGNGQGESSHLILAGLGLGTQYGIVLPFSRSHESEADLIGLELTAKAGFNPEESVTLWENMSQAGDAPPEFMSTHPSNKTRIKQLKKRIPKVLPDYQNAIAHGRRANCKLN